MEITSLQKSVETAENQLGTNDEAIQGLAEEAEKLKEKLRFGQHQFVYDLLFSKKSLGWKTKQSSEQRDLPFIEVSKTDVLFQLEMFETRQKGRQSNDIILP